MFTKLLANLSGPMARSERAAPLVRPIDDATKVGTFMQLDALTVWQRQYGDSQFPDWPHIVSESLPSKDDGTG
ncbi:hypothetical protein FS842_004000 [Serendipita sp. 407]|nr:hypothetical protein FS842_004000 [Serendipita sp. 407]